MVMLAVWVRCSETTCSGRPSTSSPSLADVLAMGGEAGATGALVSGSGPTIAFLAGTKAVADAISDRLVLSSRVRAVRRAHGPVPGARIVN